MQVVLVMFRAEGEKRSFSVTRDVTIIGRREDCDLRIPVSEVSRKHCRIIREENAVRAEDLGSSNGTFHNGMRISGGVVVEPGDSLQVGPVVFVLQVDGVPPDDELAPFKELAAHHLDDELAMHPPLPASDDSMLAAENLELLERTPRPEMPIAEHESPTSAEGTGIVDLDLSNESVGQGSHVPLNEDDLLLDLNAVEDAHEKL